MQGLTGGYSTLIAVGRGGPRFSENAQADEIDGRWLPSSGRKLASPGSSTLASNPHVNVHPIYEPLLSLKFSQIRAVALNDFYYVLKYT